MTDEKPDTPTYIRVEPKNGSATYIMVPRKLMFAWFISFACMLIMTILSLQWANYIDKKSNQRWCGVVNLFNEAYKATPPPTDIGKKIAAEMLKLQKDFSC